MAGYLLGERYKDAAAVIVGGVLEGHLCRLCARHGVPVVAQRGTRLMPRNAKDLNVDLAKADAYNALYQTSVTGWLALPNHAAHGQYDQYSAEQVAQLRDGVLDFVARTSS
jgi:hypothetical protein